MTGPLQDQSVLVIGRGSGLARAAATYLAHPARGAGGSTPACRDPSLRSSLLHDDPGELNS